jgi:hypothetical protein
MTDEIPVARKLYEIKSILKTDPPFGADGTDWYRYEIAHGSNCINGYTQGSLEEVTVAMEENVVQLNERQFGKRATAKNNEASKAKPESTASKKNDAKDSNEVAGTKE